MIILNFYNRQKQRLQISVSLKLSLSPIYWLTTVSFISLTGQACSAKFNLKIPIGTPQQPTRVLQPPPRNVFARICLIFYALVCLRIIAKDSSKPVACISKRYRILNGSILSMKLRENELLRMSWCVFFSLSLSFGVPVINVQQ